MSLDTGRYQLYTALKALRERWEDTKETWQDAVQMKFAEDVWEPVEQLSQAALSAIDRLSQAVARAKQDCGD
jgi:hypothetical protein